MYYCNRTRLTLVLIHVNAQPKHVAQLYAQLVLETTFRSSAWAGDRGAAIAHAVAAATIAIGARATRAISRANMLAMKILQVLLLILYVCFYNKATRHTYVVLLAGGGVVVLCKTKKLRRQRT